MAEMVSYNTPDIVLSLTVSTVNNLNKSEGKSLANIKLHS